jgi:hypothetical protein
MRRVRHVNASRPAATRTCLRRHKITVFLFGAPWPAQISPPPYSHFGFASHAGDNGLIMFYKSAREAQDAAARWVGNQERLLCTPGGHTMAWCLAHLPVPGKRQIENNVLINWVVGPVKPATQQLILGCLQ